MAITSSKPLVSVVVPMLNEERYILACLDRFAAQTYGPDHLDVMVVDGGSTDDSRRLVEEYRVEHPWVRIVENPRSKASAAFNRGVEEAKGEVLILFSAHGEPDPTYIEESVAALRRTGAAGIGGRYLHEGLDPTSSAIGLAMVSPYGMASPHRFRHEAGEVDTISHPAYDIGALRSIDPFDERLERNSDYELNFRMREAGFRLEFAPEVVSVYRPRPSLAALARQFWWYGRWKERVVRRHPGSLQARHLVPPLFVAGLAVAPLVATTRPGRRLVGGAGLAYTGIVAVATASARPREHHADPLVLAACFPTMHVAWGAAFLASLIEDTVRQGEP